MRLSAVPFRCLDSRTIKNGALQSGWYYELQLGVSSDFIAGTTVSGVVASTTVTGYFLNS